MAISDPIFVITIVMIFNYVMLYRKNHILGNIVFLVCGVGMMSYGDTNLINMGGIIITLGSIGSFIYDLLPDKTKKGR